MIWALNGKGPWSMLDRKGKKRAKRRAHNWKKWNKRLKDEHDRCGYKTRMRWKLFGNKAMGYTPLAEAERHR